LVLDWIVVGRAKRPDAPRGPRYLLLRNKAGRYAVVIDGEHVRVPQLWGRRHDSTRNAAAVALGQRTSPKKAAAARRNGAKGGRPKREVPAE
jgi:hypothetical protein